MNREFRNLRTGIKDLTREKKNEFPAVLGNKSGVVIVSGNIVNILTIPEGIPLQVINRTVYNRPGALVMVGKKDGSNSLEVLYELNNNSSIPLSNDNVLSSLPEHAATHQYPSYDTVFIKNFQFLPLLCLPVTEHTVRVFPGTIAKIAASGYAHCSGDTALDLSADVPASGACWELIQVDDDGTISTVTGTTQVDRTVLTGSNIPTATSTPIWAVILDSDYAELEASNSRNDLWDLRFAVTSPYVDSVDISTDEADIDGVNLNELGSNPSTPGSGHRVVFAKNDGVYEIDSNGTVVGPFGSGAGAKYRRFVTVDDGSGGWDFVDVDNGSGQYEPVFVLDELE